MKYYIVRICSLCNSVYGFTAATKEQHLKLSHGFCDCRECQNNVEYFGWMNEL